MTNFSDEAYNEKMESDIEDVRKTMRSWLFADNIKRVVVIGPGPMMAKMGPECSWGTDPVHPLPAVYQELANLVLSNMEKLENKADAAAARPSRTRGGGRDWRDRRGGQFSRGGRGQADRGSRGRFSY